MNSSKAAMKNTCKATDRFYMSLVHLVKFDKVHEIRSQLFIFETLRLICVNTGADYSLRDKYGPDTLQFVKFDKSHDGHQCLA